MRMLPIGTGKSGTMAGTPANCITEQMAQKSSAKPSGLCCVGATGESMRVAAGWIANCGAYDIKLDRSEVSLKCTCPNDNANCIVSANSADHEPNLTCDRNQRIVFRFHAIAGEAVETANPIP